MKNTMKNWTIACLLGMGIGAITSNSQASVIVTFAQDGSDVTATWSGTLATDSSLADDTGASFLGTTRANSTSLVASYTSYGLNLGYYEDPAGTATTTTLNAPNNSITLAPSSWGFRGGTLGYNTSLITGGSLGAVSELTFNPGTHVQTFASTTLAAIGAGSFSNTLAWTATTTGDTIRYNTVVPEPSAALLGGLSLLSLLSARRRHR